MDISTWLAYLAVTLIVAATPGPGIFFAISTSIQFGWHRVCFSALGNIVGLFLLSSVTAAGLGALLKTSALLFFILKIAGGCYLFYLGFRQWNSKINIFSYIEDKSKTEEIKITNMQLFVKGLLVAITNPKGVLFFSALFPQFIKIDNDFIPQFIILTITIMLCTFTSWLIYAYIVTYAKTYFSNEYRVKWFNHISGSVFMLLGINVLRLKNK